MRRSILRELPAGTVVLNFIDCDKPPLRGPQSEYLRLCRRIVIVVENNARRDRNRLCDVLTMWCHLKYKNDVFLTNDPNFKKQTKLPPLLKLGAGQICAPGEMH